MTIAAYPAWDKGGIWAFPIQVLALVEDQWEPRADRAMDHLVTAWRVHRRRLLDAVRALLEGQEPSGPGNPDSYRVHTARVTVPGIMNKQEVIDLVTSKTAGPAE